MHSLWKLASKGVALAAICAGYLLPASASVGLQASYQYPAPLPVLGSQSETIGIAFAAPGTIATVSLLTQGKLNADFTAASLGTCSLGSTYSTGQTCQIPVTFKPLAPGERRGAVLLLDSNGAVLGSQMLYGVGIGSAGVLVPPTIQTVAGNGTWVYRSDGVPATSASIFLPGGVAIDGLGNIFLSDTSNNRVRRVDITSGLISTVAGTGAPGFAGDAGSALTAAVNLPSGMVIDGAGNLLFADSGNHAIRKLTLATGVLTTIAGQLGQSGSSGDGGQATAALLNAPEGVALDPAGDLYIADTDNNTIRLVHAATGIITTVAGTGTPGASGDGGPGVNATLNTPWGIATDRTGNLYIADLGSNRIRRLSAGGSISTVVGTGDPTFNSDGQAATAANVKGPAAVAIDVAGNLYVADSGNNRVRKVAANTGLISTIAGDGDATFSGDGAAATLAGMYGPYALALDTQGNLFFSDIFHHRIRELQNSLNILSFPPIRVGRTSAAQPVTLENDGNAPLHVTALAPDGNSTIDPVTTTCAVSVPLAVDTTCVVGAQFQPQVTGNPVTATIQIQSDAANSPAILSLSGEVDALDPTTTLLTSSANPAALASAITFTATVTTGGATPPSGNIRFYDGPTLLASVTTTAGSRATFTTSTLALGVHPITANFTGDAANSPGTSTILNQVVKQPPTLTLASSLNPSNVGQSITFTATVTGPAVPPTGTVVFSEGTTPLGNGSINTSGVATFTTTSLIAGTHPITASYAGDTNTLPGSSPTVSQVVHLWSTTTQLTASANPITVGTSVTLTIHVTTPSGVVPTGSIALSANGLTITTLSLDPQGDTTFTTSSLQVGADQLVAHFTGDATNSASDSSAIPELVQTIATTAALTSSANPSSAGANLRLTATITPASTNTVAGNLTGTVTFTDGGHSIGSGSLLADGTAILDITTLPVGQHAIAATYNGATNYGSSTATINQSIQLAATAVQLSSSANPVISGRAITLTAVVSSNGALPTGAMTFQDGATTLGVATISGSGQATLSVPSLSAGTHLLTAQYGGDPRNASAISNTVSELVQPGATQITLGSSVNPSFAGATVTFVASITTNGSLPAGQTMVLHEGPTVLGSTTISSTGTASFSLTSLSAGSHTLAASYAGDTDHTASDSAPLIQVVQIGTSSTALASSKNPSLLGDSIIFTINVTGTAAQPTGTVTLLDGASPIATLTLNAAGGATLTTTTLTLGDHPVTAAYNGDVTHAGSTSRLLTQRVQQTTAVTLASSANPSKVGDSVHFTATVSSANGAPINGPVTFTEGGSVLGTSNVIAGTATLDLSTLVAGTHLILATYAGDPLNAPSTATPLSQAVNTAGTTITLTSAANPAIVGTSVVFSASVSSVGQPPAGSITFMDGSAILGTVAVSNGAANFATTTLNAGQHAIVARYGGDAGTQTSTSAVLLQVMRQATTISLTSSVNPALTLQSIALTATVANGANATGVVTFTDGAITLGSIALGSGDTAVLNLPALSAGAHTLSASYTGDTYNTSSTASPLTQTVQLRPTTILTTASSSTYLQGGQVTIVSVVSSTGPVPATGTVTFMSKGNSLGSAPLASTGAATLSFFPLASSYDIVATYGGDAVYAPSTALKYTISEGAPTTFTMTSQTTTLAMSAGGHTTFDLNFTSIKGFTDTLALGCLELPVDTTCTFSVDKMLLAPNGTGVVHLTIDTANPLGIGPQASSRPAPRPVSRTMQAGLLLPGAVLLTLLCGWTRRRYSLPPLLAVAILLLVGAGLTGCANKLIQAATPAGSYTIRIVASGTESGASQVMDMPMTVAK